LIGVAFVVDLFEMTNLTDAITRLIGIEMLGPVDSNKDLNYLNILLRVFSEGFVSVTILLITFLISYNSAAFIYRILRKRPAGKIYVHDPVSPNPGASCIIKKFEKRNNIKKLRIGLILAGGGAKGAYQAGAMKAIHKFLEANNALSNVRMIAGTSIGSWNSMFWLAGLVNSPGPCKQSVHERWWRSISVSGGMEFAHYFPLKHNYFLNNTPWREAFDQIFRQKESVNKKIRQLFDSDSKKKPMHFYFTRSNVELGQLEFATNNACLPKRKRKHWKDQHYEPLIPSDQYEVIKGYSKKTLDRMERAVFASMDLPPLFSYMDIRTTRNKFFEDGGVIDNLPMRFGTEVEACNLLFVLPLNASFAEKASETSILKRLWRVMDIRQGVLERNSIKMARLYNDKVHLENKINEQTSEVSKVPLSIFAICPRAPLSIGTTEFWKPEEAGKAFDLMFSATSTALNDQFLDLTDPGHLKMTLVSPEGEMTILDKF
jgi:predicted acylesterase/phospholipase RssA